MNHTPIISAHEAQVLSYRADWTERRTEAALKFNMRAVREAQDHIEAAGRELILIAYKRAQNA